MSIEEERSDIMKMKDSIKSNELDYIHTTSPKKVVDLLTRGCTKIVSHRFRIFETTTEGRSSSIVISRHLASKMTY
jgi:hypothetical protein